MNRILLSCAAMAMVLTVARADVAINRRTFPDDNFRAQVKEYFDNIEEDDIISDEEMEANGGHHNFDRVSNLKGIELLTSITELQIINYPDEPGITTFDYELPNLLWLEFQDQVGVLTTVDATKCTNLEYFGVIENPAGLSTLKLPSCLKDFNLCYAPLIKTFDSKQFPNLRTLTLFGNTGITDLDFSGHKSIQNIVVEGGDEDHYQLNSLNMANCQELTNIHIAYSTIKSLTFKRLPEILSILVYESDITNMLVDNLVQLGSIEAHDNILRTLTLNNLPAIYGLDCDDNKLQTLIVDNCPNINGINAETNKLMWLDLKDVEYSGTDESTLLIGNQVPSVVAWKLSPTEVGLAGMHERFDLERVLNLKANGTSVTPKWVTYDGIKYFVFSTDGANAESLRGKKTTYEYETRWPYPWFDDNTKDNNLPVTLNVTKVDKPASWIQVMGANAIAGVVGKDQEAKIVVTRSDGYDGQLTFTSDHPEIVSVDNSGKLTFLAPGTATITVTGAATDYRYAPAAVTFTAAIAPVGDVNRDGSVDGADVAAMVGYIIGNVAQGFDEQAADINGDGSVTIADLVTLIRIKE